MQISVYKDIQDIIAAGGQIALPHQFSCDSGEIAYTVVDRYGRLHRIDGPALVTSCGYQAWFLNGKLHRDKAPARIWADGYCEFYHHGKYLYPSRITSDQSSFPV